ncbi:MAG: TonB-dependent receptor [Bacteroidales bacterium]|nr:TonB-dependent receptor [Bacteroidales bacterium]
MIILLSVQSVGQDRAVLKNTYENLSFTDFIHDAEKGEEIKFYYQSQWIDGLKIQSLQSGVAWDEAMEQVLNGTGLNYYRNNNEIYIFPGKALVTDLPEYEPEKDVPSEALSGNDTVEASTRYLQTKSISEEKFLTVGSKQYADNGEKCRIRGSITNQNTGEELIGATIYVKETGSGTITDNQGKFQLLLPAGIYHISIDHMAMKNVEYGLNVLSDGEVTLQLENELIEIEEITLVNKRQSNVEGMLMGFERISTRSVKEVPVVLGEKDVIKIAQMLPGVQNAGEGSSGFNVRGGSADQNMFYINKISVYNTSHLFGFFTAFSPDIISDFSLYKNNVPSKYGGRIASIFEITTRQGNKEDFFAQGGISPITGHIAVEGPVIKEKVTFVGSFRSTYSDWILKRMNDNDLRNSKASFYDGTLGINAEINDNNQVKAFIYKSSDDFSLSVRNDYSYSNTGGSVSWKHNFSSFLSADFSVASSNYRFSVIDKNNISEAYSHEYFVEHTEARADFLSLQLDNHRLEFGINSILYNLNRGDILPYGQDSRRIPISLGLEQGIENAAYLSDEFRVLPRLDLLFGMRYSIYAQLGAAEVREYLPGLPRNDNNFVETVRFGRGEVVKTYSGFEPRAALNYRLGSNSSLKASYNRLQQYIFLLSNTVAIAPSDQWKLSDYHIEPPVSDQVSIGYYKDFQDAGINFSVEVYNKWIKNVVEYRDGADFISPEPLETQILQGSQDSYGVELMVRKNTNKLTGWVSYSFSRSVVQVNGTYFEQKINNGIPYPSNYDKPHSFNLVSNYRVSRRLSFSANVVYSTGRPVTLPVAAYYSEGRPYLLYSSRNAYRIPDYFRVDLSVNLEGNLKFKKLAHSFWMLNVYNLTGRNNAYSVFYEVNGDQINGYQLSIFARPIVTLSWNFKFGNYNSN